MVSEELQKKIDRAIRFLKNIQAASTDDQPIEIAYSGGKDSDVILQLAKEAGINYRAIYKMTTIDPPGTVQHVREMGAEVLRPRNGITFFKLIEERGLPTRFRRFCCKELKEYKVLDKAIMGVRRDESKKRAKRYTEPTECRFYGNKKEHVEAIYPILDWTLEDVTEFIIDRGIKLAPVYYDADGSLHTDRRLGCMCCPLQSQKKRLQEFKKHPAMVKAYLRSLLKYYENRSKSTKRVKRKKSTVSVDNAYDHFLFDLFFVYASEYLEWKNNLFDVADAKKTLEEYFNIKL